MNVGIQLYTADKGLIAEGSGKSWPDSISPRIGMLVTFTDVQQRIRSGRIRTIEVNPTQGSVTLHLGPPTASESEVND